MFKNIAKQALALLLLDKGFVLFIQTLGFLMTYLVLKNPSQINMMIFGFASVFNFTAILYRLYELKLGNRQNLLSCYKKSFLRFPSMVILLILASFLLVMLSFPLGFVFASVKAKLSADHILLLFNFLTLFLVIITAFFIPYLVCIYVVAKEKTPLQAIKSSLELLKTKIPHSIRFKMALCYSLPILVKFLLKDNFLLATSIFFTVWFLFCHSMAIVLFDKTK